MNTFYLARHGKTENNQAGRLSGWVDTPLTEDGLKPTETVIEKLDSKHIDKIYASDLGRAFITAYVIARGIEHDAEIGRLAGLREVSYGDAANMLSVEAYERYPQLDRDTHYTPPNGESLAHMQQRVLDTVDELNQANEDMALLLVAHSGVAAAIEASYIGRDFGEQNISEAYAHDMLAEFTMDDGVITSFTK